MNFEHKEWSIAREDLVHEITSLGFPEELGDEIAKTLGSPKAIRRMISYLHYVSPDSVELVVDEMLAIRAEIDAWKDRKEALNANARYNEMRYYGLFDSEGEKIMIQEKSTVSNSGEWTPFIHNLITLHFMDNGTSVKIYSENINQSQTIKPINDSSSQECALALKGLDVNDWDIGMDIADLRKLLFQDDALYYYIKWKNYASDHSEEIWDIKEFLDKMNYKLKGVLFWIDGFWTGGDLMKLHEQMTNNLAECDFFLQTGMWDAEPSVNAILACAPL